MTAPRTQADRVLHALQRAGDHGITQAEFTRYPTFDGHAPISRVAVRVEELRAAGYLIESGERRSKFVVYRLRVPVPAPVDITVDPVPDAAGGRLFDIEPDFDAVCPPRRPWDEAA